ncbi:NAD-dependent epimerase/dehydratase family protein [Neobacillus terrae]|uniref:NAD-dependent epimerase/dehydratase family protein n=1 Tax=Neobacillus terrae TaxID=3034837 RepID=UPI00140C8607|nr:NAD-dependent epimerase/dehydratase family protein [Neobacillus terrae]NHM30016.1 NAD-dependent epimerase/dehydratase family protein [Neobacillus terrae]
MLFVTGITGHTGKWLLDRLIKENYKGKIRCLVRKKSNTTMLDKSGLDIETIFGDLEDQEFLLQAIKGSETIIHISSILFSNNIIEAAIKNNVKWAILVHTTGRYSKYKSASEEYIKIEDGILKKRDQIGITVLRPTMIYGSSGDRNMFKLVDYLARHKFFPMFGSGENLMQPVHARDLGYAYYDVLNNKDKTFNREYNLSGKNPIKYIELVKCVSNTLNRNNKIVKVPLWLSIMAAKFYNQISKNAIISEEQVLRMQEDKVFSYEAAAKDIGYSPLSFEEGIKGEVEEYLNSKQKGVLM